MRFQKRSNVLIKKTPTFLPIIPLTKLKTTDDADKSKYITFELKVSAGSGRGQPSYKKHVETFEEGTPQEWMDVLTGLREIWKQNSVKEPTDRAATVAAILKGDSRTAFDAAMEEIRVNPNHEDTEGHEVLDMTLEHVELALRAVTEIVFPFRALETQKQWMNRYMKKPYDMPMKAMGAAVSRINNYLPLFPEGNQSSKFSESEVVELLEFSLPTSWRKEMDRMGFVPSNNDKKALVSACERIERSEAFDYKKKRTKPRQQQKRQESFVRKKQKQSQKKWSRYYDTVDGQISL